MNFTTYDLQGTIRTRLPHETMAIAETFIKTAGISRIANITGLDCINIPVFTCYRPHSKSLSTAQGKGLTEELAICSALMEAIEHYYAENVCEDLFAEFSELENAVDPNKLMLGFSKIKNLSQYKLRWTYGVNLLDNKMLAIPSDYLSLDYSGVDATTGIFVRSTTGLASGNNREEAILHSLFEMIERHCLYEFKKLNFHAQKLLLLNTHSILNMNIAQLIDKIKLQNVKLAIFDITNQFDIPAYHCIISDNSPIRQLGHHSGTGAHFSKNIAMIRAITEAVQSRLTHISGARDDMFPINYQHQWQDLLVDGDKNDNERTSANASVTEFSAQIYSLLNLLNQHGYEQVVCVEHTKNDELISVVHTVIPGMPI